MTADELIKHFNNTFALGEWPTTYEVDAETYANCCQAVFDYTNKRIQVHNIALGMENNGLIFKNVELIYKAPK